MIEDLRRWVERYLRDNSPQHWKKVELVMVIDMSSHEYLLFPLLMLVKQVPGTYQVTS